MPKPTKDQLKTMREFADKASEALTDLYSEMQTHWDDCSERWQESEHGEEWTAAMEAVERAQSDLEEAVERLH